VRPVELREPTERGAAGIFLGDVGEALRGVRPVDSAKADLCAHEHGRADSLRLAPPARDAERNERNDDRDAGVANTRGRFCCAQSTACR
jgi:hypothetical protein